MNKIFFAGGTGCIGKNLIPLLIENGFKVTAIVRNKEDISLDESIYIHGDLLDKNSLEKLTIGHDIIIHAASMNLKDPHKKMYWFNVKSTENLLECAIRNNVKRFLYFSASAVLGEHESRIRIDETSLVRIDNLYKKSKYDSEELIKYYGAKLGLDYVIIRPALVYGSYDRGNIKRLIRFLKSGFFFKIGNGNNLISLVSVKNLSNAVLFILKNKELTNNQIFLISDDTSYTVNEVIQEIVRNLNVKVMTLFVPKKLALFAGSLCDFFSKFGFNLPFNSAIAKFFIYNSIMDNSKIKNIGYRQKQDFTQGIREEIFFLNAYEGNTN